MITRREVLRRFGSLAAGVALPGWIVGCGSGATRPHPPEIALDQDTCDWCRMTIDDARLAAAFVPGAGRPLRFGEPGCLVSWVAEHPGARGTAFVAVQEDAGWLAASSAEFARGLVRTPMRFDLAAWREAPGGTSDQLTWTGLLSEGRPRARPG